MKVHARRVLDVAPTRPGERPFIAAASGLCAVAGRLFVVADDEHTLAVFPSQTNAPGARHPLLKPEADDLAPIPKRHKPDLEALCALPSGQLLALPSGSSEARRMGAVISLDHGLPVAPARLVDFTPLFERLAQHTRALNLEGAAVIGQRLWLAQRGNNATPSALFEVELAALDADEVPASAFLRAVPLTLGAVDGVPFTPTDLCPLGDGRLLVSAVCEDTADSYHDGPCVAAAVALVEPGQPTLRLERIDPTWKVEGIIARPGPDGMTLWMVCDADDPAKPSPLLEGKLDR